MPRRIVGVDRDTGLLAFAGARLAELGMGDVELMQGDACSLPLPDASLDAVTSYTLFEHLREPEAFLRECRRVVRRGGAISVASTGKGYQVHCRLPQAPPELAEEIQRLEAVVEPWLKALHQACHVGAGVGAANLVEPVRRLGLRDFRVDSWTATVCWDDHRLSESEREEFIRDYCSVDATFPWAESAVRQALAAAGTACPDAPYLSVDEQSRLRTLYELRLQHAMAEAHRPGSGPFFATSVSIVASGVAP